MNPLTLESLPFWPHLTPQQQQTLTQTLLLLGEVLCLNQGAVAPGLLQGGQVLPLQILDEGEEHLFAVGHLPDDRGRGVRAVRLLHAQRHHL